MAFAWALGSPACRRFRHRELLGSDFDEQLASSTLAHSKQLPNDTNVKGIKMTVSRRSQRLGGGK